MNGPLDFDANSLQMHGQVSCGIGAEGRGSLVFGRCGRRPMYGFRRGTPFERNIADLRSMLESPYSTFVEVGPVTADRYARKAAALRKKGRLIPTNDFWIAAHAMETDADLVLAEGHFEHIEGIVRVRESSPGEFRGS